MAARQPAKAPEGPTQDRVIEAAARLFRGKGYAGTTTREIAAELGIQKASLYYHMTSKEDLLFRICLDSMTEHLKGVRKALELPEILERLRAVVEGHAKRLYSDSDRNAVALLELRSLDAERRAEVIRLRDQYETIVQELIGRAQQDGILRVDVDAKYLTLTLLSLLNWSIFWFRPGGRLRAEEMAGLLLRLYLEGAQVQVEVPA